MRFRTHACPADPASGSLGQRLFGSICYRWPCGTSACTAFQHSGEPWMVSRSASTLVYVACRGPVRRRPRHPALSGAIWLQQVSACRSAGRGPSRAARHIKLMDIGFFARFHPCCSASSRSIWLCSCRGLMQPYSREPASLVNPELLLRALQLGRPVGGWGH
jgi:hypothetical protein